MDDMIKMKFGMLLICMLLFAIIFAWVFIKIIGRLPGIKPAKTIKPVKINKPYNSPVAKESSSIKKTSKQTYTTIMCGDC